MLADLYRLNSRMYLARQCLHNPWLKFRGRSSGAAVNEIRQIDNQQVARVNAMSCVDEAEAFFLQI
jgi:hypothetical protein